ncbi:UNVERIFIED_CONTAM: hypothetical protein NCL1_40639 [Trichonephila clavipes]
MEAKVLADGIEGPRGSNLHSLVTLSVQRNRNLHAAVVAPSISPQMQPSLQTHDATHKPSHMNDETPTQVKSHQNDATIFTFAITMVSFVHLFAESLAGECVMVVYI